MEGWKLYSGDMVKNEVTEEQIWSLFNYVFSDSCQKRNTYKYGLIKALLDNLFNGVDTGFGIFYTYETLFAKFTENYWNLIVKYDLRQMRPDGKSELSAIENIIKAAVQNNPVFAMLEFSAIDEKARDKIIGQVANQCKKYVLGALYENFDKIIYSFDNKSSGLTLNYCIHSFMLKYKVSLEKLNYYSWAKFLERVNKGNSIVRVIDKLELATPRRGDLSIYREILRREFEENTCFYCGKRLSDSVHVDHFIPWSFVKDDKIWNFVLACSKCNERKHNKVAQERYLNRLIDRNREAKRVKASIAQTEFATYTDIVIMDMWKYAKMSGLKEFVVK